MRLAQTQRSSGMTWTVALAAFASLVGAAVLSLAAWRLIPRHPDNMALIELRARMDHMDLYVADLADKFDTGIARARGRKSGEARRETADPSPPVPRKTALRQAFQRHNTGAEG